jgi:hypothetical protein
MAGMLKFEPHENLQSSASFFPENTAAAISSSIKF